MDNLTTLLNQSIRGDKEAEERVWAFVYDELRRVAHAHQNRFPGSDTLDTAALVHEAYLKLT